MHEVYFAKDIIPNEIYSFLLSFSIKYILYDATNKIPITFLFLLFIYKRFIYTNRFYIVIEIVIFFLFVIIIII